MNVIMKRAHTFTICNDCQCEIVREQPLYTIDIGEEQAIDLCEDCGNELQVALSDEYTKFIDLKK